MIRDAALVAVTSLDHLIRANGAARLSRPVRIGVGLLATGVVLAVSHAAGADLRAWLAGGQVGLAPNLLEALSGEGTYGQQRARP
jgi:uncharacterized NAD(P)/FAD-binding protein YdhS